MYVSIHKVLLDFLQYQLFLSLTVLTVTIVFSLKLHIRLHQLLHMMSAITLVSATSFTCSCLLCQCGTQYMLFLSPGSTSVNSSISTPIGISMELYFQQDEHVRKSLVI